MPITKRFIASKAVTPTTALRADFSLPSTPTSLAKQNTAGARALVDTGQTLQKVGGDLQRKADKDKAVEKELARRNQNAIDSTSKAEASVSAEVADRKVQDELAKDANLPTAEWDSVHKQEFDAARRRVETLPGTPQAKEAMLAQLALAEEKSLATLQIKKTTTNVNRAVVATGTAFESSIVNGASPAEVSNSAAEYFDALSASVGEDAAKVKFADREEKAYEEFKKNTLDNVKPVLVAVTETSGKKEGIKKLNSSIGKLVETGVLTDAEGAEANKVLGDWLDNYVSGRKKADKDALKLTTTESYNEMMPLVIGGDLTYDMIDESKLLKADKEKWRTYVKGSYKDAPTVTTPKGQATAFNAVYDASTLQLSPQEAYDVLLTARMQKDATITDAQFNWAVDKINNPYKKDTLENLKATIEINTANVRRGFNTGAEEKRLVDSNAALIQWVDDKIKAGQTPTRKEMNSMSSQFRVTGGTLVDVGHTVERGGVQWEVVGFDDDGEPLYEEVQ